MHVLFRGLHTFRYACLLHVFILCGGTVCIFTGCGDAPTDKVATQVRTQRVIDLGVCEMGETVRETISLPNNSATERLEIGTVVASCPCVTVQLRDHVIEPCDETYLEITLHSAELGDFVGPMRTGVMLLDKAGNELDKMWIILSVRAKGVVHAPKDREAPAVTSPTPQATREPLSIKGNT